MKAPGEYDVTSEKDILHGLIAAFLEGITRISRTRSICIAIKLAAETMGFDVKEEPSEKKLQDIANHLRNLSQDDIGTVEYVTRVTGLVYLTTLLETLLSELTRLLLLKNPSIMGESTFKFSELLLAKSKGDFVTERVGQKIRTIGIDPLSERIDYLKKYCSIKTDIEPAVKNAVKYYSELRNLIVHDQACGELKIGDDGEISLRVHRDPRYPTPIDDLDIFCALWCYAKIVKQTYKYIANRLLKVTERDDLYVDNVTRLDAIISRMGKSVTEDMKAKWKKLPSGMFIATRQGTSTAQ